MTWRQPSSTVAARIRPSCAIMIRRTAAGRAAAIRARGLMTYSSETKRTIAGAVAGLLYGLVLAFLSLGAVGAGHGTPIPLYVSSAPPSVFSLLPDASSVREPVFFAMLFAQPLVWLV